MRDIKRGLEALAPAGADGPSLSRRSFLATLGAAGVVVATSQAAPRDSRSAAQGADPWESSFHSPPQGFKAWVYWWWLEGAVTQAGITADLEAMKKQGIGGV